MTRILGAMDKVILVKTIMQIYCIEKFVQKF